MDEANLEVRPGTIPHGYEVGSFMIKVYDKSLPLISRFDKKKARVASATLSICSLDLPGRRSNVMTRHNLTLFLQVHCKGPERSSLLLRGEWERVLLESSQCGPFHPSEITRFCLSTVFPFLLPFKLRVSTMCFLQDHSIAPSPVPDKAQQVFHQIENHINHTDHPVDHKL